MPENNDAKTPSFEKALARLETIVREMESGSLSLEKMMEHFEEGNALVKVCAGKLNEVERKIEILTKKGASAETAPFEQPDTEA
jgi:exodeoxyribonuclease VII small subunit